MRTIDTGRIALFYEDAGKGGTPILLLHELGGSSESWARVIQGNRIWRPLPVCPSSSAQPVRSTGWRLPCKALAFSRHAPLPELVPPMFWVAVSRRRRLTRIKKAMARNTQI